MLTNAAPGWVTPGHRRRPLTPDRGHAFAAAKLPVKVKVKVKPCSVATSLRDVTTDRRISGHAGPPLTPVTAAPQTSHSPRARDRDAQDATQAYSEKNGPAQCLRTEQALGAKSYEGGPGHGI